MRLRFIIFTALLPSLLLCQDLSGLVLCLDPGHGGRNPANDRLVVPDPGVEFWESESNFQKALLLKELLEARGATVYLTRYTNDYPDDTDEPSLSARVAFANSVGADWFHSIHSNAANAVANYTLLLVRESTSSPGTPESPAALAMAQIMSPKIFAHLRTTSSQTRLDYSFLGFRLGVLSGLLMPGELSEGSFHDVFPETRRLMNNSYRKMEAHALLKSFLQYFGAAPDAGGIVAGIQTNAAAAIPINATRVRLTPEGTIFDGDNYNNGFYLFDNLTPGSRAVQFETPGYLAQTASVTVEAGGVTFLDRSLTPVSTEAELPERFVPSQTDLLQNYPNPFNPETMIRFDLPQRSHITVEVLDVLGRTVKVLVDGATDPGRHVVTWDGKNREGDNAASGVYFSRLKTADGIWTKKMLLLR